MKKLLLHLIIGLSATCLQAQQTMRPPEEDSSQVIAPPKPRSSPLAMAFYKKDNFYVKVVYGQPSRKSRQVFGGVVPYGKVWRTGANEATEITLTSEILVGGKTLKPGTYTLFTTPNPEKWTIIFNAELGQWGDYKYESDKDLLAFEVPVQRISKEVYEAFTIKFEETAAGCDMILRWDDVLVKVPFNLSLTSTGKKKKR
jgi:hypothetical protein